MLLLPTQDRSSQGRHHTGVAASPWLTPTGRALLRVRSLSCACPLLLSLPVAALFRRAPVTTCGPRHVALHAILTAFFLSTSFPNLESSFQSESVSLFKWFQSWKTIANKISDAHIRKNYFKERKGSKLAALVGVSLEGPGPHAL